MFGRNKVKCAMGSNWGMYIFIREIIYLYVETGSFRLSVVTDASKDIKKNGLFPNNLPEKDGNVLMIASPKD